MADADADVQESSGGGDDRDKSSDERIGQRLVAQMRRASGVFSRSKSGRSLGSDATSAKAKANIGSQNPPDITSPPKSTRSLGAQATPSPKSSRKLGSQVTSPPGSFRNLQNQAAETSSREVKEETDSTVVDEEQKANRALSKLPAAGYNRLKTMWAKRESISGFSNPLSTWSRPYGNHKKNGDAPIKVTYDPKTSTYVGHFDAAKVEGKFTQFGCSIQDCPRTKIQNYNEAVPTVLIQLRDELEKNNGFLVEGVFRVAASFEDQKVFKVEVDKGTFKGCRSQDDAMCMAALLKEWFRTMPVRLLNALPLNSIRAGKSDIMKELPEPNLSIFFWLIDLMADIVMLEQVNRMNAKAMAIVIAPNLYSAGDNATPQEIVQEMSGAVNIVEAALKDRLAKRRESKGEDKAT